MSTPEKTTEGDGKVQVTERRIFEIYVDQLVGEAQQLSELLIVRLRYFGEDVEQAAKRLSDNPKLAYELVQHLSGRMQELDAQAGASDRANKTVETARSVALILPESALND